MLVDRRAELERAVALLLQAPGDEPGFEPADTVEAAQAVGLLDAGLRAGPGALLASVARTQENGDSVSDDPLQVFSEMIQNADDAGASMVRLIIQPDALLVAHNGRRVCLGDVLRLGLPALTGKAFDPDAIGRFGVGLGTLRALSPTWEVHCHPFHVRFEGTTFGEAPLVELPTVVAGPEWTVFRVPLEEGALDEDEAVEWFESWDDSSLLFMRTLNNVSVHGSDGATGDRMLRELGLSWSESRALTMQVGHRWIEVRVRRAHTDTGPSWHVWDARFDSPPGLRRRHKATEDTVPVGVALPSSPVASGMIHAGLPVTPLAVAARVHAQFDPVQSRRDFMATPWNEVMVGLAADLWAAAVVDQLGGVGPDAWHLIPSALPTGLGGSKIAAALRTALIDCSRTTVAPRLTLECPDGSRRGVAELAVEVEGLTGIVSPEQIARLADLPDMFPQSARDESGRGSCQPV